MQITPPTRSALLQEPRVSIPPASLLGHLAEQGRAEAGGWRCWPGSSRMPPQAVPGPLPCLGAGRRELSTVGLVPSRKGTKSTRFPRATSASAARSVSTSGGAVPAAPWPSAVIAATPRDRSLPGRLHLLPGPKGRFPQSDSHRPPPPSSGHMVLVGAEPRSPQPIAAPPSQPVPETEDPGGCGTRPVWRRHRLRLPHGCRAAPELLALPGAAWAGRCPREVQVRLRVLATQQCHRATAAPMERAPHPHSPFPGAGLGSPALSRDPHAPLWCAPAGDKRALASPSPQPPTGQVWDPQDPRPHGGLVTATQSDVHKLPNPRVCRPTAGALGIVPGQGRGCWANSPSHVPRGSGTRPGHTPGHRELERDMSWGWHSGWSCSHERGPNPATTETHRRQDRAHRAMPAQVSPPTTLGSIVTGPQTPELRAPPPGLHQLSVGGRGLSDTGQPAQSPGSQPKPA